MHLGLAVIVTGVPVAVLGVAVPSVPPKLHSKRAFSPTHSSVPFSCPKRTKRGI
jgi:hypothetical protein